jgi:hypothetical protein
MTGFPGRAGRRLLVRVLVGGGLMMTGLPAVAHHGWSWAESEQIELVGTIQAISMVPPHPTLQVTAEDGVLWRVDLGNPRQTEQSGFTADTAKPGDPITVLGNRAKDRGEMHMKAVRITIAGEHYDMYPERIQAN